MFGSYMDDVIHLWFEIKDDPCPLLPFFSNPRRFVLLRQITEDFDFASFLFLTPARTVARYKNMAIKLALKYCRMVPCYFSLKTGAAINRAGGQQLLALFLCGSHH